MINKISQDIETALPRSSHDRKISLIRGMRSRLTGFGFARSGAGATSIEYALIAALVALGSLAGLIALGTTVQGLFQTVEEETTAAVSPETR